MKLIYSGKTKEFTPELQKKFEGKLAKIGKFIEQRGEREAHVAHTTERHLHKVELDVNYNDHALVVEGADNDLDVALSNAVEKLEAKILKQRARSRDTRRDIKGVRSSKENWDQTAPPPAQGAVTPIPIRSAAAKTTLNGARRRPKVFRVDYNSGKPMTLDEALLEMEQSSDYFVYRDSSKNCVSVLVRRSDGNFDLIES